MKVHKRDIKQEIFRLIDLTTYEGGELTELKLSLEGKIFNDNSIPPQYHLISAVLFLGDSLKRKAQDDFQRSFNFR